MKKFTALLLLLAASLACNLPLATPTRPAIPPTQSATDSGQQPLPTQEIEVTAPGQSVTIEMLSNEETSQSPVYTIKTVQPILQGDPTLIAEFNQEAANLVQAIKDGFKKDLGMDPGPGGGNGSYLNIEFKRISPETNTQVLSAQFNVDGYYEGAAHPFHYTTAINYNLETGKKIELAELFQPGLDYLTLLSDLCTAELKTRDIGFDEIFQAGAQPTPENYQVWNLTSEGLLITFNEYQVAPYAAGPQIVQISFEKLAHTLQVEGPIRSFLP